MVYIMVKLIIRINANTIVIMIMTKNNNYNRLYLQHQILGIYSNQSPEHRLSQADENQLGQTIAIL